MEAINYGSVCSGIEAASVAWGGLGWKALWFSEIEKFPSAVLNHHYPDVKNLGDMLKIQTMILKEEIEAPDVLVGGTPCQAFSIAGLRHSLNDNRGQITLAFVSLANAIDQVRAKYGKQPVIIVWENVPGVFSTKDNAFGCFIGGLAGEDIPLQPPGEKWKNAGFVYGPQRAIAWRILDAQFFGLAQRRRRVFVIGSARERFHPEKILFEFGGLRRDSAPSRNTRKAYARALRTGPKAASWIGYKDPIGSLCKSDDRGIGNQSFEAGKILYNEALALPGNWIGRKPLNGGNSTSPTVELSPCLTTTDVHAVCFQQNSRSELRLTGEDGQCTGALTANQGTQCQNYILREDELVRRLMPIEGERLQGFPDNYTAIPYRGKSASECPDGLRNAAIGNSMPVPVMKWLGERINNYLAQIA